MVFSLLSVVAVISSLTCFNNSLKVKCSTFSCWPGDDVVVVFGIYSTVDIVGLTVVVGVVVVVVVVVVDDDDESM